MFMYNSKDPSVDSNRLENQQLNVPWVKRSCVVLVTSIINGEQQVDITQTCEPGEREREYLLVCVPGLVVCRNAVVMHAKPDILGMPSKSRK